jgi:mono/diheme cytochrome c family protein
MKQRSLIVAKRNLSFFSAALVAAVGLAGAAAWGCGPKAPPPTTPEAAVPADTAAPAETAAPAAEAPDKAALEALVAKRCVGCHSLDKVNEKKADAAGWEAIVADMEKRGLKISADERKQIIDYLASR